MPFLNLSEILLKHALKTLTLVESLTQPLMSELWPLIDVDWDFYAQVAFLQHANLGLKRGN